jgi:copper chaperone
MIDPSNQGVPMSTTKTSPDLQLLDTSADGGGCGCGGCGCGSSTDSGASTGINNESTGTAATKGNQMTTNTYAVTGMTCGHCASAVTSELESLDGVTDVTVDLVAGGTSSVTVTSDQPLDDTRVAAALEEAGDYQLA